MVKYECSLCSKIFAHKGNYNKHLTCLKPCSKIIIPALNIIINTQTLSKIINLNECKYCSKSFSHKYNCIRHENDSCQEKIKINKKKEEEKEEEISLKEKNIKLEEKILELNMMLKEGINPISNNNSTNNTNNNSNNANSHNSQINNTHKNSHNTQNITINMYGKENLSHISDKKYIYIMNKGFLSVPEYILMKYFSPDMPENSNVYSADIKSKYLMIYDGHKWNIKDKKDVIESMYGKNCEELLDKFIEFKDEAKIPVKVIDQFTGFIDASDEDEVKNDIKEDIKKILYNEREKAKNNKKVGK